jgi:hypothetical protein
MKPLEYISDYTGKHTAVVIPISEWENIVRKYAELKGLELELPKQNAVSGNYTMGDFVGILSSDRADALLKQVEQSRIEWDRDF